jgi:hypothetical protein
MTLDEILDAWDVDGIINDTKLDQAALAQPRLHGKYLRKLTEARLKLKQLSGDVYVLRKSKHEFYTLGPTKETQQKGWEFPAQGRILNKDVGLYLDADSDIIKMNLRIAYQGELVAALEMIMKEITNRNWAVGRAIDFQKLMAGG